MASERGGHRDAAGAARGETGLTWGEADPRLSPGLIGACAGSGDRILDVGGGAAGRRASGGRARAGEGARRLRGGAACQPRAAWAPADELARIFAGVTKAPLPGQYAVWHDRAAFHFLTEAGDRAACVAAMAQAVRPEGAAILARFTEDRS